ncbi:MAG: tellurite resistance/C4-dicarboxylate transporter family protein [Dehalococcoidales bacterium]|nr:tellurite resistance/C4-dicarboxylate transporter family protein [Dehalococcoidales bacterium]
MNERLQKGASELFPGYFGLVMATGIISIAAYMLGIEWLGWGLFAANVVFYLALWFLTFIRICRYTSNLVADLTDHVRGPGFFTVVAGTNILGNQFVIIAGNLPVSLFLWVLGSALWFILIYTFFAAIIVRESKPSLETGIHGGWFIAVVATQSVSILGTLVAHRFAVWQEPILFFTLAMYLLGCMLYMIITPIICYRLFFFRVTPAALAPVYWVNMGAAAITTLAGGRLILTAPQWKFLQEILPFLKGFTLVFWSTGSWWLILLVIFGVWLHLYKRFPLRYDPQYWSLVFPLGMYATSTLVFGNATGLSFLEIIPRYFLYIALFAWLATFVGLVRRLVNSPGLSLPPEKG